MSDYRQCEFCGCNTNALLRACCEKGRTADLMDGSHYLGHYASGDEATVTVTDAEPHCRVQVVELTEEQRKLLTVTREVHIPGALEAKS